MDELLLFCQRAVLLFLNGLVDSSRLEVLKPLLKTDDAYIPPCVPNHQIISAAQYVKRRSFERFLIGTFALVHRTYYVVGRSPRYLLEG